MEWLITHPAEEAPEAPPQPPASNAATQALAHALAQAPAALVPAPHAGADDDAQVAAAMTAAPTGSSDSADSGEVAERTALAAAQADRVLQHAIPLLAKVRRAVFDAHYTATIKMRMSLFCPYIFAERTQSGTWLCVCVDRFGQQPSHSRRRTHAHGAHHRPRQAAAVAGADHQRGGGGRSAGSASCAPAGNPTQRHPSQCAACSRCRYARSVVIVHHTMNE